MSERPTNDAGGRTFTIPNARRDVEVVDHLADRERVGDPLAHLALREHDPVRADPLEDRAVERRCRPWRSTLPTPSFLSAIVAKMLASTPLEMATIAWSKSAAPMARSAPSSAASSWTAWVTSGAMLVDDRLVAVDREHLVTEAHQLARGRRPEPAEADDEDRGLHASPSGRSADADRLDGGPVRDRLRARREGEDEGERPEPPDEHGDDEDEQRRVAEGRA